MGESSFSFEFKFGGDGVNEAELACKTQETSTRSAGEVDRPAKNGDSFSWEEIKVAEGLSLWKACVGAEATAQITEQKDSDLVPGIYEGGFKLWEGGLDLCRFLAGKWGVGENLISSPDHPLDVNFKLHRVLELGCGHGLPGVMALLGGAEVHFQDFNAEVLTSLTSANVARNLAQLAPGRRKPMSRFFHGEFGAVADLLCKNGWGANYDLILSAETLYNLDSHASLLLALKQLLKPPAGHAYIASKTHYFGVGGGTTAFKALVKKDGVLSCSTVWQVDDGVSNKREILELTFPPCLHPYFS
ncbi:hypothetical protein BSKO_13063 [Bryopsis sp. KO-2023]|nr:hypothetical protein BSKO_13063 [Bryopsis sp. KO-2023]